MSTPQPNTVLRGGPARGTRHELTVCHVEDTEVSVTLHRGNCYDHFQETPDRLSRDGLELRVFDWTHRTYVAE